MSVALRRSAAVPKPSDIGGTARPDEMSQLTYNGHSLYTFADDKKPSETNGEDAEAFGGSWLAVSPAGAKVAGWNS